MTTVVGKMSTLREGKIKLILFRVLQQWLSW